MAEKPRFRQGTVFAKNLGFGVGFGYRNNTKTGTSRDTLARIAVSVFAEFLAEWVRLTEISADFVNLDLGVLIHNLSFA